jgi:hypothetical protein
MSTTIPFLAISGKHFVTQRDCPKVVGGTTPNRPL